MFVIINKIPFEKGGDGSGMHQKTVFAWVALACCVLFGMSLTSLSDLIRLSERTETGLVGVVTDAYTKVQQQKSPTTTAPQKSERELAIDKLTERVRPQVEQVRYVGKMLTLVPLPPGLAWGGFDPGAQKLRGVKPDQTYTVKAGENPFRLYVVDQEAALASDWFPIEREPENSN
ncbi:hypothetical protein COU76_06075 [Candidatus Peregrinibacteria bacterium CG10_big_fil_rev_8_21_14_0_10_49_10]|nr:MAG: hypothetical protein COU76_06075 [Candidatus Peregrinibacteria bacterium CG10_big_fil_rev_8_21_14_0_10_49_10]